MKAALEKSPLVHKVEDFYVSFFGKRYRSSFEVVAAILEVAAGGVSRFTIARRLNTNYKQLRRYLSYLVRTGFIEAAVRGKQILYKTSGKGLEFLRLYNVLLRMLMENAET